MPNAAALPTAAAPEMPFFDSNNPARESYNQALPNVQNGTRPNSAAQSNGAIKPAINQAHGNSYSQPFPGSSVENGSQPTSAAWSNGAINPPIYQAQDNTVSYSQPSQGSVLDSGAQPTPAANGTGVINPATYQGRGSNVNYPQPSPRPVVENGAPPTPATYSNGVNNPAILQPQGSNVSYRRPTQESVQNTHSSNGTRAEAQPYKPAPGAPDGRQVPRTALSNVNVNVNTSVPSVIPMQQPYFHAPSAQWITDGGQHLIRLSFEDAKQLYQHVLSDWHLWPVALRDHDIPPLFAYVSRGSQNVQYTIVSNSLLGQLLTPQTSGTNMFGQQQSGAQQPPKGPKKNAPKKGGRGRPKKQANIEEDQTHVDMMDYHGTGKTRQFPATGTHSQYVQAPAGQPGSTQVPGFQRGPQASSNGTLREAGSTGAAPAAYPLNANGKSQEFNGQAHGLQQPSAVGAQGINGAHRGTQFNPLPNGPVASHQSQQNVENVAISAHPLSGNDRKRPREMYETEPNIAREAKRPRTTPAVSNINHRGKPEIPQQKQEATRGPNRVQNYEENQPTVQVCIGNLDPKAVGVALNMALDALRTGQALLKARPGDDALCVPPESHIVCLPPDGSIAYYGPSNTIAAGRRWQELSATSYRAGWLAASQHHSLAMAGVPIQDIKVEVFDSRKHQLTAVLADPSPKPHPLENAAPISVHAPLDSSRGRQGPEMQAKSDKDHTGDAATNRSSLPIEFQQDNALPSTAIPASYPEKHAWSDFIPNNEQAFTRSPSVGFVEPHGLAATGTEIADAGATWSILDRIWNDPTIPSVEDLNTAGDYGEPVIPAPAAKADNAGPPKSPLNTSKVSPVNTNSVTQGPSGSAIMTREPMQAPVMSSLETPSPPIVSPGQMAEAAETSKTEFDAAKDDQAAPVVVSERRKQCMYFKM